MDLWRKAAALSLLSASTQLSLAAAQCTICSDGSPPNGKFGGIDCAAFEADLVHTASDSETCRLLQLEAFQACNCPEYPTEQFCPLCENGFFDIADPKRPIVVWKNDDGSFLMCEDVLFGDTSVEGQCELYAGASYYCGCPDAEPPTSTCSLCGSSSTIQEASAPVNLRIPPLFQTHCEDYRQAAPVFYSDDTCSQLGSDLPIDVRVYCGCDVSDKAASCQLCPAGTTLSGGTETLLADNSTKITCEEWSAVAAAVTDADYCQEAVLPMQSSCCAPAGDEPADDTPTASPASAAGRWGSPLALLTVGALWW